MILFFTQKPKLSLVVGMVGIALLTLSFVIASGPIIQKVMAFACTGEPQIPAGQGYAVSWRVQSWLMFKSIPIGPSRWLIQGRVQEGASQNCFVEDWQLQRVVFQSSRDSNRGKLIDRNQAAANELNFNYPVTEDTRDPNNPFDPAYRIYGSGSGPTRDWSPTGLYGLLFTDKDNLSPARGYLPMEWQVTGRF